MLKFTGILAGLFIPLLFVSADEPRVSFRPVTLDFVLKNAATPQKHQIETMVGGVAAFDYDNDGLVDLFFTNGAPQPSLNKSDASFHNRLYRNKGGFVFEDVTDRARVAGTGYDHAAATADYDNDGFIDLYVTGVNRDALYRNRGDGTFDDVTVRAGLDRAAKGSKPWAVSAGWFDYDRDGDLDLFVVNYVVWDPLKEPFCGDARMAYRTYCHPKYYTALPNTLYRNRGDGTFEDVSEASGIGNHPGKGMGVAFADYDRDGWIDVFVANDTVPNFLFRNSGDGRFQEVALRAGVAFNDDGRALSSMGADFRDIDNDGRPDLFVSALANETFPLFRNLGKGLFIDLTYPSKIGSSTLPLSGWSNGVFDFDNDGRKDLAVACGDVNDNTEVFSSRSSKQPNVLLLNDGSSFRLYAFGAAAMHRGLAIADFDNDGRIDLAASRIGEPAVVFRNVSPEAHWLGMRLKGRRNNRDGLGAEVRIVTASGEQWNQATTANGYASASDRRVHFGLGAEKVVKLLEVRWPDGWVQKVDNPAVDRYIEVEEQR